MEPSQSMATMCVNVFRELKAQMLLKIAALVRKFCTAAVMQLMA